MEYYNSLFIDFLSSLSLSNLQSHPSITYLQSLSLPPLSTLTKPPNLIETGKTYNYRLTSCQWFGNYSQLLINQNVTCRNMNYLHIQEDYHFFHILANLSPWTNICIGLVCGNISPIQIAASKHLLNWYQFQKQNSKLPLVIDLLYGLNDLRS